MAGTGNIVEFERLVRDDISKLKVTNAAGLCAAHNAAIRNRTAILALIAQYNGGNSHLTSIYSIKYFFIDLNIEDKDGWTPLHHAVRNNALNAIDFLFEHGVDDVRLNKQHEAPIHLAVIHNQLEGLKVSCFSLTNQIRQVSSQKNNFFLL